MPIVNITVGTTATEVLGIDKNDVNLFADLFIQNNSNNILYIGTDMGMTTTNSLQVAAGLYYQDDHRASNVFLMASGSGSNIAIEYQLYRDSTKVKVSPIETDIVSQRGKH